jgi:phage-related protein
VKRVEWLGDSLERIREFPDAAKHEAGYQLERVQAGKEPADWKPMPSVGLGVNEIRVREGGAFRVVYVAKFPEAVYVLHAFQKKARKTPKAEIDLSRERYRAMVNERKQR